MKLTLAITMCLWCISTSFFAATAQAEGEKRQLPVGAIAIYFENDLFYKTDRYYTNAVQIRAISPTLQSLSDNGLLPDFLDNSLDSIQNLGSNDPLQYNISFGLGQSIFTPKDTDVTYLQKDDRPYAGFLYGFIGFHAKQETLMDTVELTLGIVGPSALAENAQNEVHRMRGFDTAEGWDHQLSDEPGAMLTWTRNYRLNSADDGRSWGWNVLPYHSVTVGNVLTQATVGSEVRWGYNMPGTFSTSSIRPGGSVEAPMRYADTEVPTWGAYVFAGAGGRAVAHNIFLDGNTWKDSHSVDKRYLIGELNAGFAVTVSDVRFVYNHVFITEEFQGQDGGGQNYGSMSIMVPF